MAYYIFSTLMIEIRLHGSVILCSRPKPKKVIPVTGTVPGSKTSTPAGQDCRENHIPASPCVTPIAKCEPRPTVTKRDIPMHHDIVALDDSLAPSR